MGWSIGYDEHWKRDIGYGVPAVCDALGCNEKINRGLGYVCGGEPYGGEHGCGLFFCSRHRRIHTFRDGCIKEVCIRCDTYRPPYAVKPDTAEWINWKLTDESWAQWRAENPVAGAALGVATP
jgi:hypothetical protein